MRFLSGRLLTLGSYSSGNQKLGIVGGHDYGVLGYRASDQTFTLLNPWGWNNPAPWSGILHLTFTQLQQYFYLDGNCPGTLAVPWATTFATSSLLQTGFQSSASVVSPTPNADQPASFTKPVASEMEPSAARIAGHRLDEAWLDYGSSIRRADLGRSLAEVLTGTNPWAVLDWAACP